MLMNWATFYLICFAVGFFLALFSFWGAAGHFHFPGKLHLPHGGPSHGGVAHLPATHGASGSTATGAQGSAAHASAGAAQASSMSPFNFFILMAFLAWFGGTGYLLTQYSHVWAMLSLGLATVAGLIGASVVFWFVVKVALAHERALDPADYDLVGVLGKISSSIREGGTGEIIFSQAGTRRTCGARSDDGSAIPKGAEVMITRYERGIAYVRRWEDLAQ